MIVGRKPIGTCAYLGGIPAVLEKFCWSWGQLIAFSAHYLCESNEFIHLDRAEISFHSWARNGLADRMLGDFLFTLDTDHEFEPDLLARMLHRLNEFNLDVLCGLYQFKKAPHAPVLYGWYKPEGAETEGLLPLAGWGDTGDVMEVGGAGGGCLLVRRRVFDRIRDELNERPFDVIGQMGEDLSFFTRLRRLGIAPYVDVRVECPHLQVRPITLSEYRPGDVTFETVRLADARVQVREAVRDVGTEVGV
jgi:hypothetical protein